MQRNTFISWTPCCCFSGSSSCNTQQRLLKVSTLHLLTFSFHHLALDRPSDFQCYSDSKISIILTMKAEYTHTHTQKKNRCQMLGSVTLSSISKTPSACQWSCPGLEYSCMQNLSDAPTPQTSRLGPTQSAKKKVWGMGEVTGVRLYVVRVA